MRLLLRLVLLAFVLTVPIGCSGTSTEANKDTQPPAKDNLRTKDLPTPPPPPPPPKDKRP